MKTLQDLMKEITQLTTKIEANYPELYQHLDETPVTIPSEKNPHIEKEILKDYLESLRTILSEHIDSHEKKDGEEV